MKKYLWIGIIAVLLASCKTQTPVQMQEVTAKDTVYLSRINIEKEYVFYYDTLYRIDTANVTTFVEVTKQGKLHVKTTVAPDTIYTEKQIKVPCKPIIKEKIVKIARKESQLNRTARWLGYGSMLFIVGLILLSMIMLYKSLVKRYGQAIDATLNKLKKQ